MLTDFQKRKLTRQFQVYDVDGDGFITQNDFERIFENVVAHREWSANSAGLDSLRERYMSGWEQLRQTADSSNDGRVSLDEWLAARTQLVKAIESGSPVLQGLTHMTLEVFDDDGDGRITHEDYAKVARAHGATPAEADASFQKLDLNGDGELSHDELRTLVREFYTSEDPAAPGNWLFGQV